MDVIFKIMFLFLCARCDDISNSVGEVSAVRWTQNKYTAAFHMFLENNKFI